MCEHNHTVTHPNSMGREAPRSQSVSQFICTCVHAKSLQSCPRLCHAMGCSPPGSSVHEVLQTRILEWVAMPSSRGSSRPRNQTLASCGPCFIDRFFTAEPLGKPLSYDILTPFTETNLTDSKNYRLLLTGYSPQL